MNYELLNMNIPLQGVCVGVCECVGGVCVCAGGVCVCAGGVCVCLG